MGFRKQNINNNKSLIITGATGGLGSTISRLYASNSYNILLLGRNKKLLSILKKELLNINSKIFVDYLECDFSKRIDKKNLLDKLNQFKKIDVLINNAAIHGEINQFAKINIVKWIECLRINLIAPVELTQLILQKMITKRSGSIINISGGGATSSRPNFSSYAVSKTALVRFTEILADEVKKYNIRVNSVSPGMMLTKLLVDILNTDSKLVGQLEKNRVKDKLKSKVDSTKIAANLCLYLSSSDCKISGKLISAVWDPWENLELFNEQLKINDIYTLRRVDSKTKKL